MNILDIAIVKKLAGGGGGSGTDNYNDLSNLPKINDTTLSGNKSSSALGLQSEINSDSKLASDLVDDTNQDNKFVTSTEKNTWNGKQNAIDADHKINADYVDDSTSTNKFVTASDKETWNAKQNAIDNSHKLSSDLVDDANHTNKFVTSTEKQTWNAKQNAIDADHKLSSSLVSFTDAEAAALASGIDSTKVGQISTNQTNILLVEQLISDGIINVFDSDNATLLSSTRCTVSSVNGDITITSFSQWANAMYSFGKLKAGQYIISLTVSEYSAENPSVKFGVNVNDTLTSITGNGVYEHAFNANEGDDCTLCLYINYSSTTYSNSIKVSNIAVIPRKYYDMGFSFAEYAPSNKGIANEISVLETLNGAKNYSDFINNLITSDQTVNGNSVTITGTAAYKRAASMLNLTEQGNYIITLNVDTLSELNGRTCALTITDNTTSENIISVGLNAVGKYVYKFTATSELINHGIQIRVFVNNSATTLSTANTITVSDVMVVKKSVWDSGLTQYVPYALPNYDLTRLESEDRAALAEEIDAGPKNKFNVSVATAVNGIISNGTFTQDITDTKTNLEFKFLAYSNGAWVNLLAPRAAITITQNGIMSIAFICPPNVTELRFGHNGSPNDSVEVIKDISLKSGQTYVLQLNILNCVQASGAYSWKDVMICTEADWKISPKYVPHRPSYDLVAALAQNGGFIDSTLGSIIANADLNSIDKTTFAVYNEPANLPSDITGYCYVRTSVFDENSALQELYVIQPNPVSFFRIKLNNSWTVWVQTSNV